MGTFEGQPAAGVENAGQSVHDVIMEMLESDGALDPAAKDAVLDALSEVEGAAADGQKADSAPTYLSSISVLGFRGVGRQARLDLYPAPGLTVVSGRNGSGKSSFAEALELALTGTSYRWHKKETLWAESWRNLHQPEPCAIRVGFTAEGAAPFSVGIDWAADAPLTERTTWTRVGTDKRVAGTDDLRWKGPLEVWRPVLSYDELGRLFDDGPAALYDALAKLLGLEALSDSEKWLATQLKSIRGARDRADDERKRLLAVLAECSDERAERATALLRKRGGPPLDGVLALATGSDEQGQQVVSALRAVTRLRTPTLDDVEAASVRLRSAEKAVTAATGALADGTGQRVDLLQSALRFHEHIGDAECPVCGQGRLDAGWAERTRDAIASTEQALSEYRSTTAELAQSRSLAASLIAQLEIVSEVAGVQLTGLAAYNSAVAVAQQVPNDDDLANHLETAMLMVPELADDLRGQAADAVQTREGSWAPIAAQLGGWIPLEKEARELDAMLKAMTAAKKWMSEHAAPFRNMRLETIAAQARTIWTQLRQESNVDLGEITLQGTATRRRVVLGGSVDGQPTKALSVMSQGELHALALALFLPRATAVASPFRFVVLDDPIQAMDPSKIDGFVQVLSEIAQTHQVIVFSHDDRLASMIRETGTDARLIEVVREAGSKVTVRDNVNPARRQVNDVFAFLQDDRLPDQIKARVIPGLFRLAVEAAARQAYYTRQSLAGCSRAESEEAWAAAKKTSTRLALAVHGNPKADLTGWLDSKPERRGTLRLCNAVHQEATGVTKNEARQLERTVEALLALR